MGCGVFLQSDIVNQQRKGWHADEILAALCADLPLNVWIYAGGLNNMRPGWPEIHFARRDAQESCGGEDAVGFHRPKVQTPKSSCIPTPANRGRLVRLWWRWIGGRGGQSRFRGFDAVEKLTYSHDFDRHCLPLVSGQLPTDFH